ncbi:DNA alkylation repair protein [bacterium (Candidatus Blackallbacteria) CG17_big_fil_post_rev_8_21_14_2_50_48_46]|uniref:DNA alkylation repair protein n=1 Tax=bacterium (Candidatus Blackallbacteria) CG17_big_fil_post_rev_8_21_14_2_50_48_46 TaxID=2014261 RepID=A0A2M7G1D6_9BACT|nr:MAG: DNA alkylation repair protein [bacterium (Candidatus Blackallbacteria) CG18_big_fil_WC_8_21_14_2_50_49_26]PIW15519.1 MAG: DNA alkylation repair protein [bacterium (Candidatus Blackallbacteria) CG17_big_fil_post_rev_8_21_14_2_50_48_46]PIW48580.1 MAG: DNA alkylation repair protein [bacterium (Candidatus Blackallbacteria) CG13_big_fil_rev_8_21_14_2_50_49_14]
MLRIPAAPSSIQKGYPLKNILGLDAVDCLAGNISYVYPAFPHAEFKKSALEGLESLEFMERGGHIASALQQYLPPKYEEAIQVILDSLPPPNIATERLGLAVLFYLPYSCFISKYGLEKEYNGGEDPFEISMKAQYELTKRSTSEFSIRPFLINDQERTLSRLKEWVSDPDPHVRRLCSEGSRPRLPWAQRIPAFIEDPTPLLPILEALKNDESIYVRRSVANSLGDIAKAHPDWVFELCEKWLGDASKEVRWVIRHALRYPCKKGNKLALQLRTHAK